MRDELDETLRRHQLTRDQARPDAVETLAAATSPTAPLERGHRFVDSW
jgi:hypothetical protein